MGVKRTWKLESTFCHGSGEACAFGGSCCGRAVASNGDGICTRSNEAIATYVIAFGRRDGISGSLCLAGTEVDVAVVGRHVVSTYADGDEFVVADPLLGVT